MSETIKITIQPAPQIKLRIIQETQNISVNMGQAKPVTTIHGNEWHYLDYEDSANKENLILDNSIDKYPTNRLMSEQLDLKEDLSNKENLTLDNSIDKYPTNRLMSEQLDLKEELSNKENSILDNSIDKYPTNKLVSEKLNLKENLSNKENLTLDSSIDKYPTNRLMSEQLDLKEDVSNKENSILDNSTEKYPTNKLMSEQLDLKENLSNKENLILDNSTNKYPTNRLVLQELGLKEDLSNKENLILDNSITSYPTNRLVKEYIEQKVDKIDGQNLSDENYTLLEKNKLAGIEDEANKYIHPATHLAEMIVESVNRYFLSPAQALIWDSKWDFNEIDIKPIKVFEAENADTVNNLTVETAVPFDALFTDTIYTHPPYHSLDMIQETVDLKVMTNEERLKLQDIENEANNYIHPGTHSLDMITETVDSKIMTTEERFKLDAIDEFANNYTHPATHSLDMITETANLKVMTDLERTKLQGIEESANNYTHPITHSPSIIEQDESNRFVTDIEKNYWDGKPDQGLIEHGADWHDGTIKSYAGFENRVDSEISISGTGLFTLSVKSPAVSFTVYTMGKSKHILTASQTMQIDADQTITYLYLDNNAILQKSSAAWDISSGLNIPCAIIFKDGSNYALTDERHGHERNLSWHQWAHHNIGTMYKSGLQGGFGNNNLSITQGVVCDEDIFFDTLTTQTTTSLWYRNGLSGMRMFRGSVAAKGLTAGGVLAYDNGSGILQEVGNNQNVANWIYATNDPAEPIYTVVGQASLHINDARNAPTPIINLSTTEWKLIYRVIYTRTPATPSGEFVEVSDYRNVQTGIAATPVSPTSHASLSDRELANSHPATAITQSETHRFVTDVEKETWNEITDPNLRKIYIMATTPQPEEIEEGNIVFVYQE